MGKFEDLTGKRFGRLIVLERAENKNNRTRWKCKCDCGKERIVYSNDLKAQKTVSCGCYNKEIVRRKQFKDLTNKRVGKLLVIEYRGKNKVGANIWLCKCDCGKEVIRTSDSLSTKVCVSCGCTPNEEKRRKDKERVKRELKYFDGHRVPPNFIDLTGQKFTRLTVVQRVPNKKKGKTSWLCKCDCGKEIVTDTNSLRSQKVRSCGCFRKDAPRKYIKDLTGQKFGKLTVLGEAGRYKSGIKKWRCKCECGNIVEVAGVSLTRKLTRSCGCINSLGELKISQILRENGIKFEKQKTFEDLRTGKYGVLRYDFYISERGYLIEYDGSQHFGHKRTIWNKGERLQNTRYRDKLKDEYAKNKGIPLIRIPYTHYNKICLEDLLLETSQFVLKQ